MPSYDYLCEANGRQVEVRHRMSESVSSWGELCKLAEIDIGDTAPEAPVKKLVTGGAVISSGNRADYVPPCSSGPCCGGGACGLPE